MHIDKMLLTDTITCDAIISKNGDLNGNGKIVCVLTTVEYRTTMKNRNHFFLCVFSLVLVRKLQNIAICAF